MAPPFPAPTKIYRDNTYPTLSPTRPELSAKGKTVIVTGGGSGIGAETARYFAEAGAARVGIVGRRKQPLLDTKASIEARFPNTEVIAVPTDVTKKSDVDAAFAKIVGSGKLHVLISGAAVAGPQDAIDVADADDFLSSIDANIRTALWLARAFLRYAVPNAVVVDINSSGAHLRFGDVFGAYSISKGAVFRLWQKVADGRPELSVFHIQPGVVDTAMNREAGGIEAVGAEDHVSLPASFSVWLTSAEARFLRNKFIWANWDVDELLTQAREIEAGPKFDFDLVGWPFGDDEYKFGGTGQWN